MCVIHSCSPAYLQLQMSRQSHIYFQMHPQRYMTIIILVRGKTYENEQGKHYFLHACAVFSYKLHRVKHSHE